MGFCNYKNRHTVVLIKTHQKEFLPSHDTGESLALTNFLSKSSVIQTLTLKDPEEHNTEIPPNATDSNQVWKRDKRLQCMEFHQYCHLLNYMLLIPSVCNLSTIEPVCPLKNDMPRTACGRKSEEEEVWNMCVLLENYQ